MLRSLLVVVGAAAVGAVAVVTIVIASGSEPQQSAQARAQALRLAVIDSISAGEELEELATEPTGPPRKARPSALHFAPSASVRRAALSTVATQPAFGQPTIAGIGGIGFEVDIRLDPTVPSRFYMSAPGSLSSDTSWIWRTLDGGNTFKLVPAGLPLTGKAPECAGGGDTELAVDPAGRLYFNDLTLANFSTARSDNQGVSFTCSNTGVPTTLVDRQWYATDGNPLAGGSVYLTSNEVGQGGVICGNSVGNNVLVMFRSPIPGGAAAAGIQYGPPYKITGPATCDEGIMGNNEVSPVATRTGKIVNGQPTTLPTAVRHIYVVHDDATFSKIAIGRCFPVAFGPPVANVSDPSGLNCDDLPVANLGDPSQVRTGFNFPTLAIDTKGNLYAVWQQAPVVGGQPGNTSLMYSYSTNEGNTWSAPVQIPTPGLLNNIFTWAAAGSDGRVGIAWYGTPAPSNPTASCGGADTVDGPWSVYYTQTLNGHDPAGPTFTPPALVGEHYVHKGSMWTVMGGQCGSRALGDFLQLRIGRQGEAHISYADSNNITSFFGTHAMYARQIGGTGLFANKTPSGPAILLGSATDPSGDGIYEAGGMTSADMPNLDIRKSSLSVPLPSSCRPRGTPCLRVQMTVSNLTLAPPAAPDTDDDLVWLTQWLLPADPNCTSSAAPCQNGGRNLMVYAESTDGAAIRCFSGENAVQVLGGGIILTYPGSKAITAHGACSAVMGPNGTITIYVPQTDVDLDGVPPLDSKLYSVTASTMTLPAPANTVPSLGGIGGVLFNLIDVVRGYDVVMP